jgi:WD40 repeat protein
VSFAPDGREVASSDEQGNILIHNVSNGAERKLAGHTSLVYRFSYSPDGKRLASGSYDGTVRVWNLESGDSMVLRGHEGPIWPVRFSPDGTHVLSGGFDGTIRVWDVATGSSRVLRGHGGKVRSLNFSPDGTLLLTNADDGTIRIWNWREGSGRILKDGLGQTSGSVTYSVDGSQIAFGKTDGTIVILNRDGSPVRSWQQENDASVQSLTNDTLLSRDGTVMRLWSRQGHQIRAFAGNRAEIASFAVSSDERLVATGGEDSTVHVWEIASGHLCAVYRLDSLVRSVAFSPNGHSLAAGGIEAVYVFDLDEMPAPPADASMLPSWLDELSTAVVGNNRTVATPSP